MRILFTLLFLSFFTSTLQGQFKGYWGIAGGTIAGSYKNDRVNNFTDIQLDFFVGKFLSEEFLLGGGIKLGTTIRQNINMPKDRASSSETGVTVFTRYYLQQSERAAIYIRSSLAFAKIFNTKDVIGLGSTGEPFDYLRVGSGLGVSFFVNDNIAINGEVDVSLVERLTSTDVSSSENFKPQLSVGLQFFSNDYNPKSRRKKSKKDKFKALGVDTWNIGGTFDLANRIIGNKRFSLSPSVSYFTARNLGLGLQVSGVYELGVVDNRIEINPFLRYYLPMPRGYSFLEGGGGLG
ncbi:MAG: outer membrane beta-barrel protein, partial [Bacteroidota bacterium]